MTWKRKLDPKLRFHILQRGGFRCRFCGKASLEHELHVLHVKPIECGGTDHPSNLTTSCSDCAKGIKEHPLTEADVINLVSGRESQSRHAGQGHSQSFMVMREDAMRVEIAQLKKIVADLRAPWKHVSETVSKSHFEKADFDSYDRVSLLDVIHKLRLKIEQNRLTDTIVNSLTIETVAERVRSLLPKPLTLLRRINILQMAYGSSMGRRLPACYAKRITDLLEQSHHIRPATQGYNQYGRWTEVFVVDGPDVTEEAIDTLFVLRRQHEDWISELNLTRVRLDEHAEDSEDEDEQECEDEDDGEQAEDRGDEDEWEYD